MKLLISILILAIVLIAGCTQQKQPTRVIDYSCNIDSDCEIKNVGNLCGYYPQCVNKDFIPNPPELDSVVCGFPAIDGCKCIASKCRGTNKGILNP